MTRRDCTPATPPFRLTAEQLDRLHSLHPGHFDYALADMHREHCYRHRPILGLAYSLTNRGDLMFREDWEANREAHMAEAMAEFRRAARKEAA